MEKVLKKNKSILIVSQYFWPEDFRINDLALELSNQGHTVEVLTGFPNYPSGHFTKGYNPWLPFVEYHNRIKIYRVPIFPRMQNRFFLILNYISFFISSLLGVPYLVTKKYDTVFTFSVSPAFSTTAGALIAKLKGIPSVTWVLDLWPESLSTVGIIKNKRLISILRPIFIKLYNSHTKILTISNSFTEHLVKYGITKNKIQYFPNWAEDLYKPMTPKATNDTLTILYAGNLGEAQDLPTLIEAIDQVKNDIKIKLLILGDGRKKEWLLNEIQQKNLQNYVEYLGRKPQQEMPLWFAKADLLYVSLKKDPIMAMTVPGRVQSYMASGKSILASIEGETAKVINEARCGFTVPPESPNELAAMIKNIYFTQLKNLSTLGANGLNYYQIYFDRNLRANDISKILLSLDRTL